MGDWQNTAIIQIRDCVVRRKSIRIKMHRIWDGDIASSEEATRNVIVWRGSVMNFADKSQMIFNVNVSFTTVDWHLDVVM